MKIIDTRKNRIKKKYNFGIVKIRRNSIRIYLTDTDFGCMLTEGWENVFRNRFPNQNGGFH